MIKQKTDEMGRIVIDVSIANHEDVVLARLGKLDSNKVRRATLSGVVDTGASYLVLPKSVADAIGVPSAGQAKVRYADQRSALRDVVKDVDVELFGREGTFKAIVEPRRKDVLIGAIVLEDLDLLVDCRTQTIHPRDPKQIIAEIE